MKRRMFWESISREKKKRLNLFLDPGSNKRKRKDPAASPGLISKIILAAIFFAFAAFAALFLSRSVMAFFMEDARYGVAKIDIVNTRIFTADEILSISGLSKGQNIFTVDIAECRKRLEENANIKKAIVERGLPDRICVKVYEREPVAVLDIGKSYLVDDECVLLSWDERWNVKELPVISGIGSDSKFVDKKVVSPNLEEGIRLVSLYNATRMKPVINVTRVDVSNLEDIYFQTDRDFVFKLSKGCGKDKFDQLKVVFEDMKIKGTVPAVIDLRFQDVVVIPKNKDAAKSK